MTKNELIARLKDIEWDDFEVTKAAAELPKSIWESVSAFSNTSGGWIVLGVKQNGNKFEISGDHRATDMEIMAMFRDQAFGTKSEQIVPDSSLALLNQNSLESYIEQIKAFNPEFPYSNLPVEKFCEKTGITKKGKLNYGSLLMFGLRDEIQYHVNNFWIDMLEIPGTAQGTAEPRYTFRMPEQENLWEYYNVFIQRLRTHIDAPFTAGPNGFSPDDNSQLYALREGLNMLAHADYFSPMHSTIRVFTNRIEFQNPGRFPFDLKELRVQNHSMPRNPTLIKLFRYAKLSENAGYGIDKMLSWERLTRKKVKFESDLTISTVIYNKNLTASTNEQNEPVNEPVKLLLEVIQSQSKASKTVIATKIGKSRATVTRILAKLTEQGLVRRVGPDKNGHWEILNKS